MTDLYSSMSNIRYVLLLYVSCFYLCGDGVHVVDLTHEQSSSTIYWPGNPSYNFTTIYRGQTEGGFWLETNAFQTAEHGGTHLDAPAHFAENGSRTHEIPMDKLQGPGVIINVKRKVEADPDYRVSVKDLASWEHAHGKIPEGSVVLMNSGWTYKYPNKTLTFGSQSVDDPTTFHFPGWHEDAADWLVKNRNVNVVGVDTPSNDYGQSKTFPVHIILGAANICGLENVANLDSVPEVGTTIYVAVIKLHNGSGGPARVFAIKVDSHVNSGSTMVNANIILALCLYLYLLFV